jgi:penicillin-binding protein 1C
MPLPRRTLESDVGGTQVSETALSGLEESAPAQTKAEKPKRKKRKKRGRGWGCFLRMMIWGLFSLVIIGGTVFSFMLLEYYKIRASLPDIADLRERTSQFETTRILDRDGNLIYEILDPNAGRRTYVELDEISPFMTAAVVATEDEYFYSHPGFSPIAIVRAFWQNYESGTIVSGASTITQQVARMLILSPEEAARRTYIRKVREALLAAELTRVYSKDEILEIYLNEAYFGNLAYGVEAAAQTYFGTSAGQLDLAQASFLAGLPQAPSVYDVYTNREATLLRQQQVLYLMYKVSDEQGCIYVSNSQLPVCVDETTGAEAAYALVDYEFHSPDVEIVFPHWVNYVRTLLEEMYEPQTIYRSGFTVETTLDPGLQLVAQAAVQKHVFGLRPNNVQSGALVAIDPNNGEILAMVGSADYYDAEIDGAINMAVSPRQPGSSIKPITYALAFERGWTPATLIWDVRSEFPPSGLESDERDPFVPVNYDGRYHGPVSVRVALSNSYNIPAVKALQFVGVYDDPSTEAEGDGMLEMAHRLGITDLNADYYGLSLTLGGGEVQLLDLTAVYSVFANGGQQIPPVAITRITDREGNVVFEYEPPQGEQVIRPEHAFLISSILSDNASRSISFGPNSPLNLPFPAAAKTGTTTDFRDNWTMGYTPDLVVGVWVGNPDYTTMQNTTGLSGAAPIWNEFMQIAAPEVTGGEMRAFLPPSGIVERMVCAISGTEPSQWCPEQRREYFAADQLPPPASEDLWQRVLIDTWTGLQASSACPDFTDQAFTVNVDDPWGREWILDTDQGRDWAEEMDFSDPIRFSPDRECRSSDPHPVLEFVNIQDADRITEGPLSIVVRAEVEGGFDHFRLMYSEGETRNNWQTLVRVDDPIPDAEEIYSWSVGELARGIYTLRLHMRGDDGAYADRFIRLVIDVPTPTPPPTSTPTETGVPTATETLTLEPSATPTVTTTSVPPTATQTEISVPTDTPTPTETPTP